MQWSDLQFHPPSKTLGQFACLWLVCFGGLAAWEGIVREHTNLAATLAVLALTVGLVGIIWPQTMRPIYVAWMVLAFPIGWTISQVILAPDVLWTVHPDRPDLPDHRSRPTSSCPPTGLGVILVSQDNPR